LGEKNLPQRGITAHVVWEKRFEKGEEKAEENKQEKSEKIMGKLKLKR
jgi:hypothetical protein